MSQLVVTEPADRTLVDDVLGHLDVQLDAGRRLLAIVLEQGTAIRRRDVHDVVRLAGMMQAELHRRQFLDAERMALLERAGQRLGVGAGAVTLSLLTRLMDPATAHDAEARSAQLRGLLSEVQREHTTNRALMSQELAFLDHLLSLTEGNLGGYDAGGDRAASPSLLNAGRQRVLDLEC
jgi:FlgN protein